MTFLSAFQIIFDIFAGFGIGILLLKLARAPKDDPRLSRGLQILQSKIAILEDLSDRTENQVRGLMALLDQKNIEVQTGIDKAGEQIRLVEDSIRSSLDVAKIFQDKIPHQEIIERKNTLKYLQAARLANQGQTPEQIAKVIDLPIGEIEFIAKVNRDQLSFSMDELPAWAKAELAQQDQTQQKEEDHTEQLRQMPERFTEQQQGQQYRDQDNNQDMPRHAFSSDLNFLGHSIGEFEPSSEISPLTAFASEPQFQAFQNFNYQEPTPVPQAPQRELSAQDSRQLATLKRTQSLIANLDRQFSLSNLDLEEELVTPVKATPPPPMRVEAPAMRISEPPPPMKMSTPPQVKTPLSAPTIMRPMAPQQQQVSNRSQGSATYETGSIRKVVFPTINASKANTRRLDR